MNNSNNRVNYNTYGQLEKQQREKAALNSSMGKQQNPGRNVSEAQVNNAVQQGMASEASKIIETNVEALAREKAEAPEQQVKQQLQPLKDR